MQTYYTVYKITNNINGKFYIGTHKTKDINDDYYGSGKYLRYAIEKHGIENFTKEILHIFDNAEDMFAKEAEIVNEDFLAEENTYNLKIGGFGGWDYINENLSTERRVEISRLGGLTRHKSRSDISKAISNGQKQSNFKRYVFTNEDREKATSKLKEKFSDIGKKNSKHQSGKGNSQYGTMWIHNLTLKHSKRIMKTDIIPEGWTKGRKIKF